MIATRSMKNSILSLLACLLLLPTGTVLAQAPGESLDVASLGPWYPVESTSPPPALRVPPPRDDWYVDAFPARVQLSEARRDSTWFTLVIPENAQQTPHSHRLWRRRGDSLIVTLSTGLSGVTARLLRSEGRWSGTLRNFTDRLGTLLYERRIDLVTRDCDSPPPIRADEDPPLPRAVSLANGEQIELGSLLPESVATEPRRPEDLENLTVLSPRAVGQFAGADSVMVLLGHTSHRISRIELQFPREFDSAELFARLVDELGPVRVGSTGSWSNRTTFVLTSPPSGSRSGRPRIILVDPRVR